MLLYTVTFALSGVGIAAGAMVARYIGRADVEAARETAGQALLLRVGIGILLTVAGLIFSRDDLLYLLGTPAEMIDPGGRYIQITLYFGVFRLVSFVGAGICRRFHRSVRSSILPFNLSVSPSSSGWRHTGRFPRSYYNNAWRCAYRDARLYGGRQYGLYPLPGWDRARG